jgi:hypothetical protein
MENKIKKIYQSRIDAEVKELSKVIDLVVEHTDLLEQLDVKSIGELELKLNEKSGFVNAMMSATAFGKDAEYKRLLELEKLIDGRLSADDLNLNKQLKKRVLDKIRDKHIVYYTDNEIRIKDILDKIIQMHNSLSYENRKQIGYDRTGALAYNPFSTLL